MYAVPFMCSVLAPLLSGALIHIVLEEQLTRVGAHKKKTLITEEGAARERHAGGDASWGRHGMWAAEQAPRRATIYQRKIAARDCNV